MAVVSNISSEIGDIIRIQTDVPAIGVFTLNTFVDSTTNETATRYFDKYFRYSVDGGLNWSSWEELTTINIQNIEIRRKNLMYFEYRYTRVGTDPSGELSLNSVTISGESEPLSSPIFERQFFFRFFDVNDVNVLNWALNVLEKLYQKGILPDYITRNEDEYDPQNDDQDFIAYWGTITHFFAIFVYYARQFENITTNTELIYQFLDNWGIFLNTNISDTHLLYLMQNYINEFEKRGTSKIIDRGDESIPMGELLRLTTFVAPDEFMLSLLEPHALGWCVSKSSPSFNYTRHCQNMIKGYESSTGFIDLNKYPTTTINNLSIVSGKLEITPANDQIVGIAPSGTFDYIEVDDLVSYEIVVRVKQEGIIDNILFFGCLTKNEDGVDVSLTSMETLFDNYYFFIYKSLHRIGTEYEIRGIIHSKQFDSSGMSSSDFLLNIGFGYDLKFNTAFKTRYILPIFYVYRSTSDADKVIVSDFKVRPLNFNFSLGKLGFKNIMYMLYRNNSTYLNKDVYINTRDKLLPYNVTLIDNEILSNAI